MTEAPRPSQPLGPLMSPGRKDLVATALGPARVWATLGQGIVHEVYWPSPGEPQIRDLGFIVAGDGWWYEVKAVANYQVELAGPTATLAVIDHQGPPEHPYRLRVEPICDPTRDVLLIRYHLEGASAVFVMLASHLQTPSLDADRDSSGGSDNFAWSESSRLYASARGRGLCLVAGGSGFVRTSVGYFGANDLWQDFAAHGRMTWSFDAAGPGTVVLGGQLPDASGVLALAFAAEPRVAASTAAQSLAAGADAVRAAGQAQWQAWAASTTMPPATPADPEELADALTWSATVIKCHQDMSGAIVASLSTPWGDRGNDPGGYHLVWPRDAVEAGEALLALGHLDDAERLLSYLVRQQRPEGYWAQNFYPDGTVYWHGLQLDQTASPVLLAAALDEAGRAPDNGTVAAIRKALGFLTTRGPLTEQDRWEENPGGSPYTLGIIVCALVAGARYLDPADAEYALALADSWNERIEEWTYVAGSYLDDIFSLAGHYVRIGPASSGSVVIKNRPQGGLEVGAAGVLGMEFAYLARLGLRSATDQRILDTARLVDAMLGQDLGLGTGYYRYNYDGYGERIDGGSYDGVSGLGRPWPLLAGERGHHVLLAGGDATVQLSAMLRLRSPTGLVPEQVWDQPPLLPDPQTGVPSAPLYTGQPTLGATPLVWGHSELVKFAVACSTGVPVDELESVRQRYGAGVPTPRRVFWRKAAPLATLPSGRDLVIEADQPFVLHFGHDQWHDVTDRSSAPLGLDMHGVTLTADEMSGWRSLDFTRRWESGWENSDYHVTLGREMRRQLPIKIRRDGGI